MQIRGPKDRTIPVYRLVEADRPTWDRYWSQVRGAPLHQSWEYGEARYCLERFRPARFVLQREPEGTPIGLLQVLVRGVPLLGGVARITRGPVLLGGAVPPAEAPRDVEAILAAIRAAARRQRWHLVRIGPELPASDDLAARLGRVGFKRRLEGCAIASAVIDLAPGPEEIRAGFNTRWRRHLKKAETLGLELETPPLGEALPRLVREYETMKREKGFRGTPSDLLCALTAQGGPRWTCRILCARHEQQRCGMVMIVGHGDTCTYLVGWTSAQGRAMQANSFLLWQAMLLFRRLGYRYFDVGGLGGRTTKGVEEFKKGLRGREYSLIGEYSYSLVPFLK